ncbi:hypothetical protein OEZ85_010866 [Tetradesmus obliquus]|uniref:Uncharacterized protein n=1 Tax=Tetradesmus obliquus TaxID=3088 RepID=A0ABY8TQV2_TETOB|nr:hypothetical protein OEZ85_010866 [Tetradesmus obliquus]
MYQRHLQLEQQMKEALQQHMAQQQQQQQQQQHMAQQQQQQQQQASVVASAPLDFAAAGSIQAQGIMAQQLLLELYNPLASGLSEGAGGGDDSADEAAGSGGLNLQLLDVSESVDDLDDAVAQGGLRASLSGLAEAQDEAAQQALLAAVMQQYLQTLQPRDRSLLALRLGIPQPDSSTAQHTTSSTSVTLSIAGLAAAGAADVDGRSQQGMSLEQLAQHFGVKSRQQAHKMMEAAVGQLRRRLQAAAGQDAAVAQLLGVPGSSMGEQ